MIELIFNKGDIYLYDVVKCIALRKEHRIVGHLSETSCFIPTLPLKVTPEEALLLIDKGLACAVKITNYDVDSMSYKNFERELLEQEIMEYKNLKRKQVEQLFDSIVKKRKNTSREDILKEEMEKLPTIDETNMIWPVLLKPLNEQNTEIISRDEILKQTTYKKYRIFTDLWEKGYHITSGEKFGGDFLAYLGDPMVHHAVFIVKCTELEATMCPSELVACGRLGVSVKKNFVLASVKDDKVVYLTINWLES